MSRMLVSVVLFLLFAVAGAAEVEQATSDLGTTYFLPMQNAPYPHASREEGFTNSAGTHWPKDPHYTDNTVALFVPAHFQAGETIDLVFYFHGHSNDVRAALETFPLREMFVASGANAVLVFPQGPKRAGDSGAGRLEEAGAFAALADEVRAALTALGVCDNPRLGRVVLSGHSGAFRVLSFALEHGGLEEHIAEVYLLDASYGRLEQFSGWAQRNSRAVLRSIFTAHLADENVVLMAHLQATATPYALCLDDGMTDELLAANRIVFLHTQKLDHNGAVSLFGPWLAAGQLGRKP
ncbi:MAG: hypothetical protein KF858_12590 [Candidatus Sumerlaeia bacterium]|nr:hypothetical protein [Candidatus Sumerlaeia bacterium]